MRFHKKDDLWSLLVEAMHRSLFINKDFCESCSNLNIHNIQLCINCNIMDYFTNHLNKSYQKKVGTGCSWSPAAIAIDKKYKDKHKFSSNILHSIISMILYKHSQLKHDKENNLSLTKRNFFSFIFFFIYIT